jgi:N-acetylmuramoyl-L-alanine amidase
LKDSGLNRRAQSPATGKFASALGLCVLLCGAYAQARVHHSRDWAEGQFSKAEAQRETLKGRAEQARTRREYETVIASYRRIVLEAPTSSKADASAFQVAELTARMGRHFKDEMALYSAVREYKYLRREYPGSRHRIEALLAIAEIYHNDLGDESDARPAFEELLRRYPRSELAKLARSELKTLTETANSAPSSSAQAETGLSPSPAHSRPERSSETKLPESRTAERGSSEAPSPADADTNAPDRSDSEKPVRVTDVEYWSSPEYTRVTIDLQQDVRFVSGRISHPDRIFFDLKNARLTSHLVGQNFNVDDGLVKRVRVAQFQPGLARVVVETAIRASYNASLVLNPPRLIIDIHGDDTREQVLASGKPAPVPDAASKTVTPAAEKSTEKPTADKSADDAVPPGVPTAPKRVVVEADDDDSSTLPAAENSDQDNADALDDAAAPTVAKKEPTPAPHTRSRRSSLASARSLREADPTASGDRSLIRTLGLKIGKIVIDPGHGGHDTGTIGPHGLYEKDLVLDVSKRLGKLLGARLGAQVVFTRRDDTFIPLETRTAIANQEQADLFVSVHANSSHDPDASGVETYYLNFTSSPEALEVAARENAASDKSIHELQDLVKKIALKEKIEESREFAADVQQSLHRGLVLKNSSERDRGVKKAPFIVLIGANMPSILAEISFLSNPTDERRLRTPEYRQRIAESLYRGIARYVNGLGGVKLATRMEKEPAD